MRTRRLTQSASTQRISAFELGLKLFSPPENRNHKRTAHHQDNSEICQRHRQCTYNVAMWRVPATIVIPEKQLYITYSECVFVT
jgi:hypothetical protein